MKSRVESDTKNLIKKALDGCEISFENLISNYRSSLYSHVYKKIYYKDDVEDLLQEVFIRIYKYLDKYNFKYSFLTWIFKIADNLCNSYLRKNYNNNTISLNDAGGMFIEGSTDIETKILNKEKYNEIKQIIDSIGSQNKKVLLLRQINGFSYKVIANMLNLSEGSVKMKVLRTKRLILKKYDTNEKLYEAM